MSSGHHLQELWRIACDRHAAELMIRTDSVLTYQELVDSVRRICAVLDTHSVASGDRVIIQCTDDRIAAVSFIACLLDGKVPVLLGSDCGAARLRSVVESVQGALLFTDATTGNAFATNAHQDAISFTGLSSGKSCPERKLALVEAPATRGSFITRIGKLAGGRASVSKVSLVGADDGQREPELPVDPDELAYLLFTSGTTSAPSGVRILRRNLFEHLHTLTRLFNYDANSRIFNATPLAHTDGLVHGLLIAAVNGGALLKSPPLDVGELEGWLERLRSWRATHFVTNPTVLAFVDRYAAHDDYVDHGGFFGIISSAANLGARQWERLEQRLNCSVFNLYGMTETVSNALYAGNLPGFGTKGTIGKPIDCEARIKPLETEVANVGSGELQIRGGNVCDGYWNDPVRTAESITDDGWLNTGDLVRKLDDDSYEFLGRLKSVINSGGTMILPQEIDEVLLAHPSVSDSVTIGVADELFEEIAVSCVQLKEAVPDEVLFKHCRLHLAALKVPKHIVQLANIPRGDAGKPVLMELRELVADQWKVDDIPSDSGSFGSGKQSVEQQLLDVAAQTFRADRATLSLNSSTATVPAWDSFTHIHLVLAIEEKLSVSLSPEQIAGSSTLAQLLDSVMNSKQADRYK